MNNFQIFAGIVATILPFVAYAPYLRDTAKGKTRPNPITWLSWLSGLSVATAILIFNGGGGAVWMQLAVISIMLAIIILAFKNGAKRDIKPADLLCFAGAIIALALWQIAKNPALAMTLLALVGIFGVIPTVRKSWSKPHTETLATWLIEIVTTLFGIAALATLNYTTLINPLTNIFGNLAIILVCLGRRQTYLNVNLAK